MSKVNLSTRGGTLSELEKRATVDLPTGEAISPAPESSPSASDSSLDQLMAGPAAQPIPGDLGAAIDEGAVAAVNVMDEQQRQDIAPLHERFQQETSPTPSPGRWLRKPKPAEIPLSKQVDGGISGRAQGLANAVRTGDIEPSVSFAGTVGKGLFESGNQVAAGEAISESGKNPFLAAVTKSQGLATDGTIDPNFVKYGSYITENTMADLSFGSAEAEIDPVAAAFGEAPDVQPESKPSKEPQAFKRGAGDDKLGQTIHQEWARAKGISEPGKLPAKEAAILGATFKDMWARQNPKYIKRIDNTDGAAEYQLTSEGQVALEQGSQLRAKLFNKKAVRPTKTAIPVSKLPGTVGATKVKSASGKVGSAKFGGTIEAARNNLAQVPNVVDKQRAKILLSTILPVLADPSASRDPNHPHAWMAEINNIGPDKYRSYIAAEKSAQRKMQENPNIQVDYNKEEVMNSLIDKVAQEVQSIAQERNGANYLTYYVQAFNGRLSPQQTLFNPTSSKAVRFVTRNATPSIVKPGTRVEKNLRQMYAMTLLGKVEVGGVKEKGDALLPELRDAALLKESAKLEKWGDMLAGLPSMSDAEYEAVSQAIADGKPLNDPVFQSVKPMEIQDPELVNAIKDKGEDGPHFIDGLIDFAKYQKAKRNNQPFSTYFNAYIDGKTNGIASNGIQMGSRETALTTGVLRSNRGKLLDAGDIRDQVKNNAINSIDEGWDGDTAAYESELNTVARAVFSNRDFNKHTTMTFGYGKEIASFGQKIEEVMGELAESNPDVAEAINNIPMPVSKLAETLLGKYTSALEQALSKEAIDSRLLMRSSAALHAAMNELMAIKSYTGMDLLLGKDAPVSEIGEEVQSKIFTGPGESERVSAYTYETEATSSAARSRTDEEGNITSTPGEYAYGGSLPGPVQSLDAATVAMSAAGKSWDRLKVNSHGNPYMHSIYDAFKTDANGFDVIVEEVNKNWLKAAGEWSYLEQTRDATKKAFENFNDKMRDRSPDSPLSPNERAYMDWMLALGESKTGNPDYSNLRSRMQKLKEFKSQKEVNGMIEKFERNMRQVGYNMAAPPEVPTAKQLKTFVSLLATELNLRPRMDSMIDTTNRKKRELVSEIKRRGWKAPNGERIALQYYAH